MVLKWCLMPRKLLPDSCACPWLNRPLPRPPLSAFTTPAGDVTELSAERSARPIRHGKKSALVRASLAERQQIREGWARETLKLIGEAQGKGEEEVTQGESSPQSEIQMSLAGFQGHWIVFILPGSCLCHCLPILLPLASFASLSSRLHRLLLNHSLHWLGCFVTLRRICVSGEL